MNLARTARYQTPFRVHPHHPRTILARLIIADRPAQVVLRYMLPDLRLELRRNARSRDWRSARWAYRTSSLENARLQEKR